MTNPTPSAVPPLPEPLVAKYLTHPHASVYGCTLSEAMMVYAIIESVVALIALGASLLFGLGLLVFLMGFMASVPLGKHGLLLLGKKKVGKPYGSTTKQYHFMLHQMGLKKPPYMVRQGRWDTRRRRGL